MPFIIRQLLHTLLKKKSNWNEISINWKWAYCAKMLRTKSIWVITLKLNKSVTVSHDFHCLQLTLFYAVGQKILLVWLTIAHWNMHTARHWFIASSHKLPLIFLLSWGFSHNIFINWPSQTHLERDKKKLKIYYATSKYVK